MITSPSRFNAAVLLALTASVACGGPDNQAATGTATPTAAANGVATSAPPPNTTDGIELNVDMLNAFERGLRREMDAVRAAQQRASTAKTPQERGEAIQGSFETNTIPAGAEAAGLAVERYRQLRTIVMGVFRNLDMQGKIDGPMSIDLSRADDETKERLSRDALADLSPESAEALREHMDKLVPLWVEYVNLTAVSG